MNNKRVGNSFESQFCKLASQNGFWAHKMQDNKNGQPADVILCKNNIPALIDCKVCENNIFPLSRMEENQINAMTLFLAKGNKHALFALLLGSDIRMITFSTLNNLRRTKKSLNKSEILAYSIQFDVWKGEFD